MILGIFIIGIVLNKIIALPQELRSNNKASVWIYNEYLNSCLYASGYSDEPITYDYCNNSIDNKQKEFFQEYDGYDFILLYNK